MEEFVEATEALKVGHGFTKGTDIGPLTIPQVILKVSAQIDDAKKHGGIVILGGPEYPVMATSSEPTIITGMEPEMLISREESFAPVCAMYKFSIEEEVVQAANETSMRISFLFLYQ
jgi:succinate-semialdehyde dehydrogenase/glutarate-semialdehyde dehydrogenase